MLSLIVGAVLVTLGLSPMDLVSRALDFIAALYDLGFEAFRRFADYILVGAVIVTIRDRRFLTHHWGASALGQVLGGLRHRFMPLIHAGGILGSKDDECLLIAVTAGQWAEVEAFRAGLHRAAAEGAMTLPDGHRTRVAIATRIALFTNPADPQAVIDDLETPVARPGRIRHARRARSAKGAPTVRCLPRAPDANLPLFARAEALLAARGP